MSIHPNGVIESIWLTEHDAKMYGAGVSQQLVLVKPAPRPEIPGRIWLNEPDGTPKSMDKVRLEMLAFDEVSTPGQPHEPRWSSIADPSALICEACGYRAVTQQQINDHGKPALPVDNRHPQCVKEWPDCYSGGYDPACCRFPKSCSCES
ncbi:hypothetical protein [Aurantimicrobium sp.]|uniref:hypothetical protein n=1 Tax=Aurantimicrobium sp. TaxID=1930784 RepID=UPI002FCC27C3